MSVLEISDVTVHDAPLDWLHGAFLDSPKTATTSDIYAFVIEGWALSRTSPVACVEVLHDERPVVEIPLGRRRPDISTAFGSVAGAASSGFKALVGVLHLRPEFEVVLRLRLEEGTRLNLAQIRGRRQTLPGQAGTGMQPLMVNTLGRTGSTWVVGLLSCHPQIVGYIPFRRDARVSTYWMSVFQDLAQPRSYLQQFNPDDIERRHWWVGEPESMVRSLPDPEMERRLGTDIIESLASMCRGRIDSFYDELARSQERKKARYFVEKYSPSQLEPDLLLEIYPGAREVILVRDFRDMLCSMLAFNAKRGYNAFGRDQVETDSEYVTSQIRPMAENLLSRLRRRSETAHVLRYEDLVMAPTPTLHSLLEYLDLDSSEAVIDEILSLSSQASSLASDHKTKPDAEASVGRWQVDLPPDVAELADEVLGPLLAEFGY
jgi:hypothetical protein